MVFSCCFLATAKKQQLKSKKVLFFKLFFRIFVFKNLFHLNKKTPFFPEKRFFYLIIIFHDFSRFSYKKENKKQKKNWKLLFLIVYFRQKILKFQKINVYDIVKLFELSLNHIFYVL